MGGLNAAPTFVAMIMKLKMEWDTLANQRGIKNVVSKIIVNGVFMCGRTEKQLLAYLRTVLDILKHHRATIILKSENGFSTCMIL